SCARSAFPGEVLTDLSDASFTGFHAGADGVSLAGKRPSTRERRGARGSAECWSTADRSLGFAVGGASRALIRSNALRRPSRDWSRYARLSRRDRALSDSTI